MKVLSLPRGGGKTTEAVEWVRSDPRHVLLVMNEDERRRLIRRYSLPARQVVLADSARNRLTGLHDVRVGVDNIDLLDWRTLLNLGWITPHLELVTETR